MENVIVGIDLGTTYSAVAKVNKITGELNILKNSKGNYTTPSVIAFDGEQFLFGEEAKDEQIFGGEAASFYKRELANEAYTKKLGEKSYDACELSSLFLKYLVKDIEATHNLNIQAAVISVPAYFTHIEIEETLKAADMAGLKILGVIHEPTAAALAYGLESSHKPQTVLFYDLGGGTFDVTVARIKGGNLSVLGSSGDSQLGGKDFDQRLIDYFLDEVETYLEDENENHSVLQVVLEIEKIKKKLSEFNEITVPITISGKREEIFLERSEFEALSEDLVERTIEISESLLNDLSLKWNSIDKIILVGGSTNMPMIPNYFNFKMGKNVETRVDVDEAVAIGAAIKARMLSKENQVTSFGFKKTQQSVGFLQFSDVTSHGMGMIALNERGDKYINSIIIPKNSKIPISVEKKYLFKPTKYRSEMDVFVLQGEDSRVIFNTFISRYIVKGFDFSDFGNTITITLTYSYNKDGLIEIFAKTDRKPLEVVIDALERDISWANEPPQGGKDYKKICIAIDTSGSMAGEPMRAARDATLQFINQLDASVDIALISVADTVSCICSFTNDNARLREGLQQLFTYPDGDGNLGHPFNFVSNLMDEGLLIVLADGVWFDQETAIKAANSIKSRIDIVGIGFGSADEKFLSAISSIENVGGLTNLANLSQTFSNVAQVISTGNVSIGFSAVE